MARPSRLQKCKVAAKKRRNLEAIEYDRLAAQLPFPAENLDKLSILRLVVYYLRMKTYSQKSIEGWQYSSSLPQKRKYKIDEGDEMMKCLNGFLIFMCRIGRIQYVSSHVEQVLGIKMEQLIGQNILEFIHDDDSREIAKQFCEKKPPGVRNMQIHEDPEWDCMSEQAAGLEDLDLETFVQERLFYVRMKCYSQETKKPSYMYVQFRGKLKLKVDLSKKSGHAISGLIAICRPMQSQIVEVRMNNASSFLSRHDMSMKFVYCDNRISALVGYDPDEVIGKTAYQFHNPLDAPKIHQCHLRLIKHGRSTSRYYRFLAKQGQWVWMQTQAYIVYKGSGVSLPQYVACLNWIISEEEASKAALLEVEEEGIHDPDIIDSNLCPHQFESNATTEYVSTTTAKTHDHIGKQATCTDSSILDSTEYIDHVATAQQASKRKKHGPRVTCDSGRSLKLVSNSQNQDSVKKFEENQDFCGSGISVDSGISVNEDIDTQFEDSQAITCDLKSIDSNSPCQSLIHASAVNSTCDTYVSSDKTLDSVQNAIVVIDHSYVATVNANKRRKIISAPTLTDNSSKSMRRLRYDQDEIIKLLPPKIPKMQRDALHKSSGMTCVQTSVSGTPEEFDFRPEEMIDSIFDMDTSPYGFIHPENSPSSSCDSADSPTSSSVKSPSIGGYDSTGEHSNGADDDRKFMLSSTIAPASSNSMMGLFQSPSLDMKTKLNNNNTMFSFSTPSFPEVDSKFAPEPEISTDDFIADSYLEILKKIPDNIDYNFDISFLDDALREPEMLTSTNEMQTDTTSVMLNDTNNPMMCTTAPAIPTPTSYQTTAQQQSSPPLFQPPISTCPSLDTGLTFSDTLPMLSTISSPSFVPEPEVLSPSGSGSNNYKPKFIQKKRQSDALNDHTYPTKSEPAPTHVNNKPCSSVLEYFLTSNKSHNPQQGSKDIQIRQALSDLRISGAGTSSQHLSAQRQVHHDRRRVTMLEKLLTDKNPAGGATTGSQQNHLSARYKSGLKSSSSSSSLSSNGSSKSRSSPSATFTRPIKAEQDQEDLPGLVPLEASASSSSPHAAASRRSASPQKRPRPQPLDLPPPPPMDMGLLDGSASFFDSDVSLWEGEGGAVILSPGSRGGQTAGTLSAASSLWDQHEVEELRQEEHRQDEAYLQFINHYL